MALTELEVKKVKAAAKQQKLSDGGGLYLLVHTNGGKYWQMAYRFGGKQKTLSLGVYPDVSLALAGFYVELHIVTRYCYSRTTAMRQPI